MKILIDVCMHTHMGYMRVHLYYDVCALYNVACIREVPVKEVYAGLFVYVVV